jgi:flavodoxin I
MGKTAIFYGSTEGNTENVALKLKDLLGGIEVFNVANATAEDLAKYDNILFGASTWEIGELQEDWESFIDVLDTVDFKGKTVAFFGTGDADGYPDTFVDALGIIYERIKDKGAKFIGQVDTADYTFDDSRALVDGKFIGLPLDEDNESDKTDERLKKWVAAITGQLQ